LELQRRDYPDAEDYWDGNWVTTRFRLDIPQMPTTFLKSLHLGDLLRFRQELARLSEGQQSQATLAMLEDYLFVEASLLPEGGLKWSVKANVRLARLSDRAIMPPLHYDFYADPSSLTIVLEQVESVLMQFPIKSPRTPG